MYILSGVALNSTRSLSVSQEIGCEDHIQNDIETPLIIQHKLST